MFWTEVLVAILVFLGAMIVTYINVMNTKDVALYERAIILASAAFLLAVAPLFTDIGAHIVVVTGSLTLLSLAIWPEVFVNFFANNDKVICGAIGLLTLSFILLFWNSDQGKTLPAWAAFLAGGLAFGMSVPMLRLYANDFQNARKSELTRAIVVTLPDDEPPPATSEVAESLVRAVPTVEPAPKPASVVTAVSMEQEVGRDPQYLMTPPSRKDS